MPIFSNELSSAPNAIDDKTTDIKDAETRFHRSLLDRNTWQGTQSRFSLREKNCSQDGTDNSRSVSHRWHLIANFLPCLDRSRQARSTTRLGSHPLVKHRDLRVTTKDPGTNLRKRYLSFWTNTNGLSANAIRRQPACLRVICGKCSIDHGVNHDKIPTLFKANWTGSIPRLIVIRRDDQPAMIVTGKEESLWMSPKISLRRSSVRGDPSKYQRSSILLGSSHGSM